MDPVEKRNRVVLFVALAVAFAVIAAVAFDAVGTLLQLMASEAEADSMETECWVFCQPDGIVNVRSQPKKNSAEIAWAVCGTKMTTNGKIRDGYMYVYDMAAETTAGWISTKYVVFEEPKAVGAEMIIRAEGRVACRKCMDGKIVKWYRDGDRVNVYWLADGWAVTDKGYIRYEYLEEE